MSLFAVYSGGYKSNHGRNYVFSGIIISGCNGGGEFIAG